MRSRRLKELLHSGKPEQKCRFSNDDFSDLTDDALISAKVVVSVLSDESVEEQESEEFIIRCSGAASEQVRGGVGKKVRAFSEGLIELDDRDAVELISRAH